MSLNLTLNQETILERVYRSLRLRQQWPLARELSAELSDENIDLVAEASVMADLLQGTNPGQANERTTLTLAGLSSFAETQGDVALLVEAARTLGERYRADTSRKTIPFLEIATAVGVAPERLRGFLELVGAVGDPFYLNRSADSDPNTCSFATTNSLLKYRQVSDIADMLRIRFPAGLDRWSAKPENPPAARSAFAPSGSASAEGTTKDSHRIDETIRESVARAGWYVPDGAPLGKGGGATIYRCFDMKAIRALLDVRDSESGAAYLDRLRRHEVGRDPFVAALKVADRRELRTRREIRVLQETSHPNLIRLLGADDSTQPRWYVMDLYERGPARPEPYVGDVVAVFRGMRQIALALGELHKGGVIHRDVKPGNILLARTGDWILADPGIAFDTDETRYTTSEAPQSKDWVPPWPQDTETPYDARWDLFMLSKAGFYLLSGRKPVHITWLRTRRDFSIADQFPHLEGIDEVSGFFKAHLVDTPEEFASATAGDYVQRIDAVLRSFEPLSPSILLYTFTAPSPSQPIRDAGHLAIRIGRHCRRLIARAVVTSRDAAIVDFQISTADGVSTIVTSSTVRATSTTAPFTDEMVAIPGSALKNGWYLLNIRLRGDGRGLEPHEGLLTFSLYGEP